MSHSGLAGSGQLMGASVGRMGWRISQAALLLIRWPDVDTCCHDDKIYDLFVVSMKHGWLGI